MTATYMPSPLPCTQVSFCFPPKIITYLILHSPFRENNPPRQSVFVTSPSYSSVVTRAVASALANLATGSSVVPPLPPPHLTGWRQV